MKNYLACLSILFVGSYFSQQIDCSNFSDKTKIPSPDSYRVEFIKGAVEATNLPNRQLSCEELQMVFDTRNRDEDVVVVLDAYTQIIIFKSNN